MPTIVFVARAGARDRAAVRVVSTRVAELSGTDTSAEFVLADARRIHVIGIHNHAFVFVAAVRRSQAFPRATFLRFLRHGDAMVRNVCAIEVRRARIAIFSADARFAQNAELALDHRVSLA